MVVIVIDCVIFKKNILLNLGCCYIFSALNVLESRVAIEYKTTPLKYSAQNNLECVKTWDVGTATGCNGGR